MPVSVNTVENGDPPSEFEDIDIAEEELIDAYVRNQLSVDERKLIEKGLRTSPQLIDRLHFARLLAGAGFGEAGGGVQLASPASAQHEKAASDRSCEGAVRAASLPRV